MISSHPEKRVGFMLFVVRFDVILESARLERSVAEVSLSIYIYNQRSGVVMAGLFHSFQSFLS